MVYEELGKGSIENCDYGDYDYGSYEAGGSWGASLHLTVRSENKTLRKEGNSSLRGKIQGIYVHKGVQCFSH